MKWPIIVLEGINGTGKSTYAKALREITGLPIFRPFRRSSNNHWSAEAKKELLKLGLPVNSAVEDMCAADTMVQLGVSAILDRSLPSALVHGIMEEDRLAWWQGTLGEHSYGVLVVYLEAPLLTVQKRLGERAPSQVECKRLGADFAKVFQSITFPKMIINTDLITVHDGVARIVKKALGVKTAAFGSDVEKLGLAPIKD